MKKHLLVFGIIILFVFSSVPISFGYNIQPSIEGESQITETLIGPMDSAWPMYGHDARHTFQSQYNTSDNPGIEKWRYIGAGHGSPVIDNNGNIYYGAFDGFVTSLFSDGSLRWRTDIWGYVSTTLAIDENGIIYVSTTNSYPSYFYALDLNGSEIWTYEQGWENPSSSPTIGEDGTIYFGDESGYLFAIKPDGKLKWRYRTVQDVYSSPAIDDDGNIYCISEDGSDGHLYAFSYDGKLKWKKDDAHRYTDASIDDNGTIYYLSYWDLYAVNSDGSLKWSAPAYCGTTPAISNDGIIYVGYDNVPYYEKATLKAYNSENGDLLWSFSPGDKKCMYISTPAISADGILYFVTTMGEEGQWDYECVGGELISLNPDGTERWREWITNSWVFATPTIGEDGTLYVIAGHGNNCVLHAFGYPGPIPTRPTINGPNSGKPNTPLTYSFTSVDPDGGDLSYYIDWGDGNITNWTDFQPSREPYYESHTWTTYGAYTIRAKAKDTDGYESDWGELTVTMPRDKSTNNMLFWRLIGQFPMLERLLFISQMF